MLLQYHEKQYRLSGNYALSRIRKELFPAIKDVDAGALFQNKQGGFSSLIACFSEKQQNHILLVGEGGMGKTVSLLKTCEYLLNHGINAVYIPLSKLSRQMSLDQYLEKRVCGRNPHMWDILKALTSIPYQDTPNLVLLLDGLNEMPPDYLNLFLDDTLERGYFRYPGVRVIVSSRWYDPQTMTRIRGDVTLLETLPLDETRIQDYLSEMGLPPVTDRNVLSVLRTPLLLTLYADVESHREKYETIRWIQLEEHPNTAGKILSNFFQTQLFRAYQEIHFDLAAHYVLLEYLLPRVAWHMTENQSLVISEEALWDCADEIADEKERYAWYKRDRLRRLRIPGGTHANSVDTGDLLTLAEQFLHFLHETENGYEFLHQSFRDYFAAFYVANEIWALNRAPERANSINCLLEQSMLNDDILHHISDITHEEEARPELGEHGWVFPRKSSQAPSEKSVVEPLLDLWRGKEGENSQIALANLISIMKIGRSGMLAWCDYANLDLRKCWLNGCHFVEWYRDTMYPSKFDGAWIDRECFVKPGHRSNICAVCTDGARLIFSGDESGNVKIYDLILRQWVKHIQPQNRPVVDIAWNARKQQVEIAYSNVIFSYSLTQQAIIGSIGNESRTNSFRYVRVSDQGECAVAYDLEPLVWKTLAGEEIPSTLSYDVPAKCAQWHPNKQAFVRSNLLQLLSFYEYDQAQKQWKVHPGVKKVNPNSDFLCLRDICGERNGSVSCIQYSPQRRSGSDFDSKFSG